MNDQNAAVGIVATVQFKLAVHCNVAYIFILQALQSAFLVWLVLKAMLNALRRSHAQQSKPQTRWLRCASSFGRYRNAIHADVREGMTERKGQSPGLRTKKPTSARTY
jgi:hypothetical protein